MTENIKLTVDNKEVEIPRPADLQGWFCLAIFILTQKLEKPKKLNDQSKK